MLDPETAWQDPAGAAATLLPGDPRTLVEALAERVERRTRGRFWLRSGRGPDRAAAGAIAATLGRTELGEPRVAAELGVRLPAEATLVVASSMPVRDVETFFPLRAGRPPRVLSNRGANGIDGTVSTAFGVAAAATGPVVLLIGDVALLHDLGGLLAARRLGLPLVIVLLDNDGGGIFHFLPVATQGEAFEEHVATPHGTDFAHAAALFGLRPRAGRRARAVPGRARRRARLRAPDADPRAHRPRGERHAPPRACGRPSGGGLAFRRRWRRSDCWRSRARSPRPGARPRRGSAPGDIVLVDKKGRRFHALVTELEQLETGRYELIVRPLDSRISYRTASVREVLDVWRKRRAP